MTDVRVLEGDASEGLEREIARSVRPETATQLALFDLPLAWEDHWWGMPSFVMRDARPVQQITVNFHTWDDVVEFGRRLGVTVYRTTDTVTFPPDGVAKPGDYEYGDAA